jgi:hypothetical protein
MDTETLMNVVAMIDLRIANLSKIGNLYLNKEVWDKYEEYKARANELQMLNDHLQSAIEADIVAMESNTGE